jgi:hypothetical protein
MARTIGTNVRTSAADSDNIPDRWERLINQPHGEYNSEFRIRRYLHYTPVEGKNPLDGYIVRVEVRYRDKEGKEFWEPIEVSPVTNAVLALYSRTIPLNDEDEYEDGPRSRGQMKNLESW